MFDDMNVSFQSLSSKGCLKINDKTTNILKEQLMEIVCLFVFNNIHTAFEYSARQRERKLNLAKNNFYKLQFG